MAAMKKDDIDAMNGGSAGFSRQVMNTFGGYDLVAMNIPESARPCVGDGHAGKHGYTLRAGDAVPCLQSDVYNVSLFIYIYMYIFI